MKRLQVLALVAIAVCFGVQAVRAQNQPLTSEQQMAQIKALIERSQLIPKVDQLSFAGRLSEALPMAERLLELSQPALGATASDTAWALERLARVQEGLGRWADAERVTVEALRIREGLAGPTDPMVAENRNRIAIFYEAQGRQAEAERLYELHRQGGSGAAAEAVASRLNYLSVVRESQGRYDEAELLAKRTLALRQQLLGAEHPDVGLSLNNLAMIYWAQGRRREVEPLLDRAVAILETARGRDHPEVGRLVANLASVIADPQRDGEVEALHKRAIAIDEKAYGPDHRSTLIQLNNLASFYRGRGRLAEADTVQTRVVGMIEASLARYKGNDLAISFLELPTFHARALTLQAGIRFQQARHDEALNQLERALALEEQARGREHPAVAFVLSRIGAVHVAQARWPAAYEAYARASAIHVARFRTAAARQGESRVLRDADGPRDILLGAALAALRLSEQLPEGRRRELADEAYGRVQWAQRSSASAALAHMSARFAGGSDALAKQVRERQDLAEESAATDRQLSNVLAEAPSPRAVASAKVLRQRVAEIDGRLAEIDQRLKTQYPAYFALVNPEPLSAADTQRLLGSNEVLIQYAIGPKESMAWAFSRDVVQVVRIPLGEAALAEKVETLRCGLDEQQWVAGDTAERCGRLTGSVKTEAGTPFHLRLAHELYAALLKPFEDTFKGKQLLIVPTGALASLPFGVLVTEPVAAALPDTVAGYRAAAWLGRRQAITVLPSVAGLGALRTVARTRPAEKSLVGFGNPLLEGDPAVPWQVERAKLAREKQRCPATPSRLAAMLRWQRSVAPRTRGRMMDVADVRFQAPLPETTDELCAVAKSLGAPESDLRLGQRATEAEVKRMSAAGELARYRVLHFATHGAMAGEIGGAAEPGLIFTPPANASDADDGYLTASEIAQLRLNADWVILSACNTGAADGTGAEALSGIARSFFYAGARALLVSHWAVNSDATVRLITKALAEMTQAEKLRQPIARAEAMRRSMAAMIDTGAPAEAHPAYWAPFVVVGEGAAVP